MKATPARDDRAADEKRRVLIADDDPVTLRALGHYLTMAGYDTVMAADGREAIQQLGEEINTALFDLEMPHVSGLDCLRYVRKNHRDISVIMISGRGGLQDAVAAMKEGAFDYITKPFNRDELLARVNQACRATKLARDNAGLRAVVAPAAPSFDFIARSPLARQMLRQVTKAAKLDSTVMLTGESGTGKTIIARMIHQAGTRAAGPFVTVNCASLPRDLVEAELFGHTKGAFTGAVNDRPGRAEIADGGTLFLDEIGDMPLELQPKLLTFLQDRTFQRIGSNRVYTVDVRLIAATHQDLAEMCRERRFREDLYFRLNVISLRVPTLRERVEDIPELARQTLQRIGRHRGQPSLTLDATAEAALLRHPWRGNVRELENLLERASAFCEDEIIRIEDLMLPDAMLPDTLDDSTPTVPMPGGGTLDELEKQAILNTLEAVGGNKAEAARRLGISEKSIYNKMKRFGLS
jgi:DNA-binding NtrC family response regulator